VTKVGSGFGYYEETPLAKGRLCYSVSGFSLHCNTARNPGTCAMPDEAIRLAGLIQNMQIVCIILVRMNTLQSVVPEQVPRHTSSFNDVFCATSAAYLIV
jgi:hypothetical protein